MLTWKMPTTCLYNSVIIISTPRGGREVTLQWKACSGLTVGETDQLSCRLITYRVQHKNITPVGKFRCLALVMVTDNLQSLLYRPTHCNAVFTFLLI